MPSAKTTFNGAHLRIPATAILPARTRSSADFRHDRTGRREHHPSHDHKDGSDYLYTLLVPSDANSLFPCFDQPDLKARAHAHADVPRAWNALANGITEHVDSSADGRRLALPRNRSASDVSVRICRRPVAGASRAARATRRSGCESRARRKSRSTRCRRKSASALGVAREVFRQSVSVPTVPIHARRPRFPFGGMEHPGVTMFNEESFIFREPPTLTQRLGRRATIYHEVAHHWFGDDMTMRWFDDLWLKEGFATYMAAKMQDIEGLPNPWMSFYLRNKPAAYDVDQTSGTTPVWQELANLDQAKSNYGAIVYNKAPGILKQLNYLVGDSAFRAGVHNFLIAHAYGNATWQDLLALDRQGGEPLAHRLGKAVHPPAGNAGSRAAARHCRRKDPATRRWSSTRHRRSPGTVCGRCARRSHSTGRAGIEVAARSKFARKRRSLPPRRGGPRRISSSQTRATTRTG